MTLMTTMTYRISIHAPLTGSDGLETIPVYVFNIFQSTLPLRGATTYSKNSYPEGGISIHTPLTGSDCLTSLWPPNSSRFQSTLPLRGATMKIYHRLMCNRYFNPRSPYGERRHRSRRQSGCPPFQSTLPLRGATLSAHRL